MERLVRYVARLSGLSRRKAEDAVREGRVKVNGIVSRDPALEIDESVVITIDNRITTIEPVKLYMALYKPVKYMSDLQDPKGRSLARDLIKLDMKLYPVGRLDYHSEGLMIFTNDGDFANEIMHPSFEVEKEYLVKFKGVLKKEDIKRAESGVIVDGEALRVKKLRLVEQTEKNCWYSVIVSEGKNRMIRKIGEAINHPVLKLKRIRIGSLLLGDLQPGEFRYFEKKEAFKPRRPTRQGK